MFVHWSLFYAILLKNAISKANEWNVNKERERESDKAQMDFRNFSIAFVFFRLYVCEMSMPRYLTSFDPTSLT